MNLRSLPRIDRREVGTELRVNAAGRRPGRSSPGRLAGLAAGVAGVALLAVLLCGCASSSPTPYAAATRPAAGGSLMEGDVVQIVFPGATNLNTVQKIPLDGAVTIQFGHQIKAAGRTPQELQDDILNSIGSNLQLKEVSVTLLTSSAVVYVSGAVLRPGKVALERPMTALEAIMESGGFDPTRAKTDRVVVIRYEKDKQVTFRLNLHRALQGHDDAPFFLQPFDIVHVPAKVFNL